MKMGRCYANIILYEPEAQHMEPTSSNAVVLVKLLYSPSNNHYFIYSPYISACNTCRK